MTPEELQARGRSALILSRNTGGAICRQAICCEQVSIGTFVLVSICSTNVQILTRDLLRAERAKEGSADADLINSYIKEVLSY